MLPAPLAYARCFARCRFAECSLRRGARVPRSISILPFCRLVTGSSATCLSQLFSKFRCSPLGHHLVHGNFLETAGPGGMAVVLLLEALLARGMQIRAASDDHIVAAVGRWIVDGLMLAHEAYRYRRRYASKWSRVGG